MSIKAKIKSCLAFSIEWGIISQINDLEVLSIEQE